MIGRRRIHDPERNAAEYVSGELRPWVRRRLERHLRDCEDCGHEVALGRAGRRLAEAARELAPGELPDHIRVALGAQ
ncbi:MAG: zf-HC2 domain-containing protein [Actinobacteria bacterium]|nr:zf-HC2 domain-containing protein [Actinomycetota bacterium]